MSTQIDFRTLPANVPVLCIPRVYPNISESRIRKIFDELDMGNLERIDIVSKNSEKGEKFNRVFVHFRRWNDSENARVARERLLNGKEIKIIYDDPWFWKISAYREAERKPSAPQNAGGRKATLQIDSDDERCSSTRPVTSYRNQDARPRPREDSRVAHQASHSERHRPDVRRHDDRPVRRRDDSRERRRPDVTRHDDRPVRRHNDSRATRQGSPLERPRHQNMPAENPKFEPRSPSSSPPRERIISETCLVKEEENQFVKVDYGNVPFPCRRKMLTKTSSTIPPKKPLTIEDDKEPGEVSISSDQAK